MANKYLEKIAGKLPIDAKNLARNIISSQRKGYSALDSSKFMGAGYSDAPKGSMRHDVYRARKIADRVTMDKSSALLQGRKLLSKVTSSSKVNNVKITAKAHDSGMIGTMMDRHGKAEEWAKNSKEGKTFKTRLLFPDGYRGFIRAGTKGVRSRLYK